MARTGRPPKHVGCVVDGCRDKHWARGWCGRHYARWLRTGSPSPDMPVVSRTRQRGACTVERCDKPQLTRGYCNPHYLRWRKGRPLGTPLRHRAPNGTGSRWTDRNGYVLLTLPGEKGRISEHRMVMERKLGRSLVKGESVHHINGVKHDNRPDNLELWYSGQPAGQRVHDLVDWARDILERYGE